MIAIKGLFTVQGSFALDFEFFTPIPRLVWFMTNRCVKLKNQVLRYRMPYSHDLTNEARGLFWKDVAVTREESGI